MLLENDFVQQRCLPLAAGQQTDERGCTDESNAQDRRIGEAGPYAKPGGDPGTEFLSLAALALPRKLSGEETRVKVGALKFVLASSSQE